MAFFVCGKCVPEFSSGMGCSFRLRSLHSTENPGGLFFGYPGFWVVDMFDWLLVGFAAFDQHDEGYYYERYTRRCCGGDYGERLVAGACEVLG